jgi:hypothetical protein
VTFRAGHVVLVRSGRVLWRSRRTFRPGRRARSYTDISGASASRGRLAYVVSTWAGTPRSERTLLFVTRLGSTERLVHDAGYPLGWTPHGLVTALGNARRVVLRVWRADGTPAGPALDLPGPTWTWDFSRNRVAAVTAGRLVRTDGLHVATLARLGSLAIAGRPVVAPLGDGLVALTTTSRLAVLDGRGSVLARAALPAGWRLDGTIAASRGLTVYEATPGGRLPASRFRLYAAGGGSGTRLLGSYAVPPTCAGHGLTLRGSAALLTAGDLVRVYDAARPGRMVALKPVVRWLRRRGRAASTSWY